MSTTKSDFLFDGIQIKIIGVGDGGCNAVMHMNDHKVPGVEYICVNTDAQALCDSSAPKTIQLGKGEQSSRSRLILGQQAASQAEVEIRAAIEGSHMLFVTAGMGGGTGTGAAPVIARIAKSMSILTVGVVTMPFDCEDKHRWSIADAGLSALQAQVDSMIVLPNKKILQTMTGDVILDEGFGYVNDQIKWVVCGISEIIQVQGYIGVDFEDVRTVMSAPGKAWAITAAAAGPDRARRAAEHVMTTILQDCLDLSAANGVLVIISAASSTLKLSESKLAMNAIRDHTSAEAHVIYGMINDASLNEEIRVTVVATGLKFES